jgi:hypothetical protein
MATNGIDLNSIGPAWSASTIGSASFQQHAEVSAIGRVAGERHDLLRLSGELLFGEVLVLTVVPLNVQRFKNG